MRDATQFRIDLLEFGGSLRRMRSSVAGWGAFLALMALVPLSRLAAAQGTARSMDIDVSIRSAGLGGASDALFWGEERDHWANPALLGYEHGIRYEHGNSQLAPGLPFNIRFITDVLKVGGGGVGLVFSGHPFDQAGVNLDYGTDNISGSDAGQERVRSWGFGVSGIALYSALMSAGSEPQNLDRWGDISFGMNFKGTDLALGPAPFLEGSTTSRDHGTLIRLTPYDGISDLEIPMRVDLSFGFSRINDDDSTAMSFSTTSPPTPITHQKRNGFGIHFVADPMHEKWPQKGIMSELGPGLEPLIAFGFTTSHVRWSPAGGSAGSEYQTDGYGFELTLARVFSYRIGKYRDLSGDIDGTTRGWSVGLPLARWAGGYYEEATWPQARNAGLRDMRRKAVGLWLDPFAIWNSLHD